MLKREDLVQLIESMIWKIDNNWYSKVVLQREDLAQIIESLYNINKMNTKELSLAKQDTVQIAKPIN